MKKYIIIITHCHIAYWSNMIDSNVSLILKIIYSATAPPLKKKIVTVLRKKVVHKKKSVTGECSLPQHKEMVGK